MPATVYKSSRYSKRPRKLSVRGRLTIWHGVLIVGLVMVFISLVGLTFIYTLPPAR